MGELSGAKLDRQMGKETRGPNAHDGMAVALSVGVI